jgi:hypothetical protein
VSTLEQESAATLRRAMGEALSGFQTQAEITIELLGQERMCPTPGQKQRLRQAQRKIAARPDVTGALRAFFKRTGKTVPEVDAQDVDQILGELL